MTASTERGPHRRQRRPSRRFAWYGRLSTKDKQDATLSFPSQRKECAKKVAELDGRIVCEFTDQDRGRRDDRVGWGELVREAKEPEARRFDAVIIYSTSRLSRDLFHALAYERELARAGIDVFYALSSGDQTSPEGRLVRHLFQALDQFEVEKLGREVRRGQTENTRVRPPTTRTRRPKARRPRNEAERPRSILVALDPGESQGGLSGGISGSARPADRRRRAPAAARGADLQARHSCGGKRIAGQGYAPEEAEAITVCP